MTLQASDIPFERSKLPQVKERIFRERGEQRYSLELLPAGITFEVDRLRRSSHELWGEMNVTVNGSMPRAKTVDGVLSLGDLNFTSIPARTTRAKLLSERSGYAELDWHGFLDEFAIKVINADRGGKPAVVLADVDEPNGEAAIWWLGGFPLLRDLPLVLFGDSSSGKSYFAMYLAGSLADQGVNVLYADWEFALGNHRTRFGKLFRPMPKQLWYTRCERSIRDDLDRLIGLIRTHNIQYVICDSVGFALDGPAETQEASAAYFRHLRQLGVGTLNVAHIPKQFEDGKEAQIFGSAFFRHGARSVWFIQRAAENAKGELRFGLYHRKYNEGDRLSPRAYRLVFEKSVTHIETIKLDAVEELEAGLPILDRVTKHLKGGAQTLKQLCEELNLPPASVRSTLSRHKSKFIKIGNKYGLVADGLDF